MSFFATEYTIHFDDTMAYGSHHFLTAFKFQCAVRETFLFGDRVFDNPGVPEALAKVHLFTSDAYSRNLNPLILGDRVAILQTLEDWGRASVRFCYRVISESGVPICAGFQMMICADAETGNVIPTPDPLWNAMRDMQAIEEVAAEESFRDRALAGGSKLESLFSEREILTATNYLKERYPKPGVVSAISEPIVVASKASVEQVVESRDDESEVWAFAGQGAFDASLLCQRVNAYRELGHAEDIGECIRTASQLVEGDAGRLFSGDVDDCAMAVADSPALSQVAIHVQNVLGAELMQLSGRSPDILLGHSFGEIAALGIAGCFSLAEGVRIVGERVLAIEHHAPQDGGLLLALASREKCLAEAAIVGLDGIVIAGRNSRKGTVLSGPREQLKRLSKYFKDLGITTISISSPTSFHHPELRGAAAAWLSALRQIRFKPPAIPVYSPIGRRFVPNGDDIAAMLANQFVQPFDLCGSIDDLVGTGATKFVDCGTTGSLGKILQGVVGDAAIVSVAASSEMPEVKQSAKQEEPVAQSRKDIRPTVGIVGMGCLLPSGASSPELLFDAIDRRRLGVVDQRSHDPQWEGDFYSEELQSDRSTSFLTGRVRDEDIKRPPEVDAQTFRGFSRAQKLLCIALVPCLSSLRDSERVMCLVGSTADGYEDQDTASSLRFAGVDPSSDEVASQFGTAKASVQEPHDAIQEVFDKVVRPGLDVVLLDAACASSLYTVALGTTALELGNADVVLAGGVFCPGPGNSCLFSQFHGTTATGCRPFDAGADGVVFSEGSAFVVLRRVDDAEQLGMPVAAVVRGVGLSSDGWSSSANVPQTEGQLLSLERCYAEYEIDPATIDAIEAHGTSTPVGDTTELRTLTRFYQHRVPEPIPVHSLKGLLGHAGWAAGTASVIAVSEYLRRGVFPGQAFHQQPSDALVEAAGTLFVPTENVKLSNAGSRRIAIDGFGFGGANGHVVLEAGPNLVPAAVPAREADELVVVGLHQIDPDGNGPFDRSRPVEGHLVLPDLLDDMDITQKLAVELVDRMVTGLALDEVSREQVGVVLALSGKSERGVEATMRVLAPRFKRVLADSSQHVARIEKALNETRPSGGYTLQCMMPNVASGRASLLMDLHGANFVVDAGTQSWESALMSASLLLQAGNQSSSRLVVVGAIEANRSRPSSEHEFAAALAMTTRSFADQHGLDVIASWDSVCRGIADSASKSTRGKVLDMFRSLGGGPLVPSADDVQAEELFPIYEPSWVELPMYGAASNRPAARSLLAIVSSGSQQIDQLPVLLERMSAEQLVFVVGPDAAQVVADVRDRRLVAVDLTDANDFTRQVRQFSPDVIVAIQGAMDWNAGSVLSHVANDNGTCEAMFLAAKAVSEQIRGGNVELYGLVPGGWDGTIHPATGALAGMLKAMKREMPDATACVVSTRTSLMADAWACLEYERLWDANPETEVVYDENRRLARRLTPVSVSGSSSSLANKLDKNSVIIATGGARGVTSVLLDAILRDYGCTVVAFGRSKLDPTPFRGSAEEMESQFYEAFATENPGVPLSEMRKRYESTSAKWEAWKTMQQLAEFGQVEYLQVDVANEEAVTAAVESVARKYGKVDLVVHGAGIQLSKRLEDRTLEEFRRTYSVKVLGLQNIVSACSATFGKLPDVHALTSAYSVFGNDGQHDYGAANETLDRICELGSSQGRSWSSVAWLAWDGIGMTRGSEYKALAKQRGLAGLDFESGQRVFRKAIRSGASINVPLSESEHLGYRIKTLPTLNGRGRVLELPVRLSEIDCLPFHKVRDTPTLPGAWTLDRMVQASMLLGHSDDADTVSLEDVSFTRFVRFAWGFEPNMRVVVQETADGIQAWMVGDILMPDGGLSEKDTVFARARVRFASNAESISKRHYRVDVAQPGSRLVRDPFCGGSSAGQLDLSGPFDCLRQIQIGSAVRTAQFASQQGVTGNVIPALLLDSALRLGAMHATSDQETVCVPITIGRITARIRKTAGEMVSGQVDPSSGWRIVSSNPTLEESNVYSQRTEVIDADGSMQLTVDDLLGRLT